MRCILYLAAMSAVRHDLILRVFHHRLRAAGKKPIVALTAAMRKLVVASSKPQPLPSSTPPGNLHPPAETSLDNQHRCSEGA